MFAAKDNVPERMLTTTELANLFGVHRRTALRWVKQGLIGHWRPPVLTPNSRPNYRIPYSAYLAFRNKFSTLPLDEQRELLSDQGNEIINDEESTGE